MKEALAARVGVGLNIERGWPFRNEGLAWLWGVGVWTPASRSWMWFSISVSDDGRRSCEMRGMKYSCWAVWGVFSSRWSTSAGTNSSCSSYSSKGSFSSGGIEPG